MATLNIFSDLGSQSSAPDVAGTTDPNLRLAAQATAKKYNLDPDMFSKMISGESSYNPNAISNKGAIGLGQLMPTTASMLGVQNPKDPYQNLEGSAKYLRQQIDRFGDPRQALAAYNWGPEHIAANEPWPAETTKYVNNILGAPKTGKLNIFSDLHPNDTIQTSDQNSQAQASSGWGGFMNYLKGDLGPALRSQAPNLIGAIAGGLVGGPPGVVVGAGAATLARSAEQAGLVQSGQLDPETAARNVRNTAISNLGAGFGGEALNGILPAISKWTYAKLAGVAPDDAKGMIAVQDMLDRNIPPGLGFYKRLGGLKDTENTALDAFYDSHPMGASTQALTKQGVNLPPTVNAVNKRNLFGDVAQYYIHNTNAPRTEIEAAIGKDGYNLIEKVRNNQSITQQELDAVIKNQDKNNAWGNFFGRKGNEFSFSDARTIKQALQGKIDIASKLEGMQAARANLAHFTVENVAKNTANPVERAAYLEHNAELEKLINIENLPKLGQRPRAIIAGNIAMPVAGAMIGGGMGYYTHQDPWAATARGAMFGAMTGATLPSAMALLMKSPAFAQGALYAGRQAGQTTQRPAPQMTEQQREQIMKFLQQDEQ